MTTAGTPGGLPWLYQEAGGVTAYVAFAKKNLEAGRPTAAGQLLDIAAGKARALAVAYQQAAIAIEQAKAATDEVAALRILGQLDGTDGADEARR
jgi:hypothetical protein